MPSPNYLSVANSAGLALIACVAFSSGAEVPSSSGGVPRSAAAVVRLENPKPMVIAHRGCRRGTAENSLASLRACIERGVEAVELDVRATRDGVPVVLHDESL